MREKQNKEQFIARLNRDTEVRKDIHNFYLKHFLPNLKDFDGKVFNKRFVDALNKFKPNDYTSITFNKGYETTRIGFIDFYEIEIRMYHSLGSYGYFASLFIRVIVNKDGRIDYAKTINDDRSKHCLDGFLKEIETNKKSIKQYDKFVKRANELDEAIEKFANDVPWSLRCNLIFQYAYRLNKD